MKDNTYIISMWRRAIKETPNDRVFIDQVAELIQIIDEMEKEAADSLERIVRNEGFLVPDGEDKSGWWDSQAISDVVDAGDQLVKMGFWEVHPGGYGRRQFYRPNYLIVR